MFLNDCCCCLCRIDLALTGLKYVFKCIDWYWRSASLSPEDRQNLINIQVSRHYLSRLFFTSFGFLHVVFYCLLQLLLAQQHDLRHLFILLIRIYRPQTHSLSHLKCVVKLNHNFLMMTQQLTSLDARYTFFDLKDHVYKYVRHRFVVNNLFTCYILLPFFSFASPSIMRQYGHLLTDFRQCSPQTIEQVRCRHQHE